MLKRSWVEIDLNLIKKNYHAYKNTLKPNQSVMAVVKADAYGHDGVACADALYGICDVFAVALVEEGIELRLGGIDKEILVLVPPMKKDLFPR